MKVWAIVPMKPLDAAKTRLSLVLNESQRARLASGLFHHTLDILTGWESLAGIMVVSADPQIWEIAVKYQVNIYKEPDVPGLNTSLNRASVETQRLGAETILVIPGDLPFLDRVSLQSMLDVSKQSPCVVIAPNKSRTGTNVLLVSPNGVIPYYYGENSFRRHFEAAMTAQIPVFTVDLAPLAIDIDLPEDLLCLRH
jgi:2-phospho-L-lactate guanylyltransferase